MRLDPPAGGLRRIFVSVWRRLRLFLRLWRRLRYSHQLSKVLCRETLLETVLDGQLVFVLLFAEIACIKGQGEKREVPGIQPAGDFFAALRKGLRAAILSEQPDMDGHIVVGMELLVTLRDVVDSSIEGNLYRQGRNILDVPQLFIALVADLLRDRSFCLIAPLPIRIGHGTSGNQRPML